MSRRPGLLLPALLLPIAANAQIVLPGTQPGDLVNWPVLKPDAVCHLCHGEFTAEHMEPWDTWAGSMMANAARDPLFWAAVDIANQDVPDVGEFCIRCHSPRAWLAGRSLPGDGSDFVGDPFTQSNFKGSTDYEGVDCQFCHRMYEGEAGTPYRQNGQYWVDDGVPQTEPDMRGPYDDSDSPGHETRGSDYHRGPVFCAVCHDLRNPVVNLRDENGVDLGSSFPEQLTFTEWSQSRFPDDDIQCQTCHMPASPGFACTNFFPHRDEVPRHEFAGANAWMTGVIGGLYAESLDRTQNFDASMNLALDMLQNRSATLRIVPHRTFGPGDDASLDVRVTNLTGHKLPTGYPEGRRMWLQVVATDGKGTTLYESGAYDLANAELLDDPDLRVYETVHGTHAGGAGFHLVLNDRIFKDTRIPPAGFVPNFETMPVGAAFEDLGGGELANWDDAPYAFSIPPDVVPPVTVTASLWYQTSSREYVEFLRDENVSGPDPQDPDTTAASRGQKMYDLWTANDRCPPILMDTVSRRITRTIASVPASIVPPRLRTFLRNPFRDRTVVRYSVPAGIAKIAVYDVAGRKVRELVNRRHPAGDHEVAWDGTDERSRPVGSGSYFVRLEAAGYAPSVKRVLLLR